MAEAGGLGEIVEDRLLGGRLLLRQPRKGHRAGSDAVLLAAALPESPGPLADFGAGVGTVGLAAALLRPDLRVSLIERDPAIAALAAANIGLNHLEDRAEIITADVAAIGLVGSPAPASFGCVAMNPPFFAAGAARPSPVANRRAAHVADQPLALWLKAARRLLRPDGRIALIHRAEALGEILEGLASGFGAVSVLPVHAVADKPAIRVVVIAQRGSGKPVSLLPGFVLHRPDGRFTEHAEAVHRGEAALP